MNSEILEKIQKLLRLSESSNINEATLAAQKASELLLKYQIDISFIDSLNQNKQEKEKVETFTFDDSANHNKSIWKGTLASIISEFFNCKIYFSGSDIKFIGRQSDLNAASYLYKAILNQISELCDKFWQKDGILSGIHGKTWKSSFRYGMIATLRNRLKEQKQSLIREYSTNNSNALVVFSDLEREVSNKYSQLKFKSTFSNSNIESRAYYSGTKAGQQINIGNNQSLGRSHNLTNSSFNLPLKK